MSTTVTDQEFELLHQLVGGYLNQDMDLWADSVPQAVSLFANEGDDASRKALGVELDRFLAEFGDDAEAEFERRFNFDFMPSQLDMSLRQFFAMTKTILADPESWRRFDKPGGGAS